MYSAHLFIKSSFSSRIYPCVFLIPPVGPNLLSCPVISLIPPYIALDWWSLAILSMFPHFWLSHISLAPLHFLSISLFRWLHTGSCFHIFLWSIKLRMQGIYPGFLLSVVFFSSISMPASMCIFSRCFHFLLVFSCDCYVPSDIKASYLFWTVTANSCCTSFCFTAV